MIPLEIRFKIFDLFLVLGEEIIFKFIISLLSLSKESLLKINDFDELNYFVKYKMQ